MVRSTRPYNPNIDDPEAGEPLFKTWQEAFVDVMKSWGVEVIPASVGHAQTKQQSNLAENDSKSMTTEQFIQTVQAMRSAQRDYFRTRDPKVLALCKDLERQVDTAIKHHHPPAR